MKITSKTHTNASDDIYKREAAVLRYSSKKVFWKISQYP